jgi:cytochrome c biogenesis protein ResB
MVVQGETMVARPGETMVVQGETMVAWPGETMVVQRETMVVWPGETMVVQGETMVACETTGQTTSKVSSDETARINWPGRAIMMVRRWRSNASA